MGDADEEAGGGVGLAGSVVDGGAWVLFEDVVDMLEDGRASGGNGVDAFCEPSYGWAECDSCVEDFALFLEVMEGFPEGVVVDLLHADVVELEDIDVIGLESGEGGVHGFADGIGAEVLRDFALAAALVAELEEVVADFGGDDDLVALVGEGFCDEGLAAPVAVGISCVEEGDAEVEGLAHEVDGFVV